MTRVASRYLSALLAAIGGAAIAGVSAASAAGPDTAAKVSVRCGQIFDRGAPLRCYETVASDESQRPGVDKMGAWRFVRTRDPQGGPDAVSIMHTADTSKSDLDLAGLMIRCSEGGAEVAIILIRTFPLRAQPLVVFGPQGSETQFKASIAPPGTTVLLPRDVTTLMVDSWSSLSELFVRIDDGETRIRGVVSLAGLQKAYNVLLTSCPAR